MMIDADGQPIEIGDRVACNWYGTVMNLSICTVVGFTPKMVRVEKENKQNVHGDGRSLKYPNQIALVVGQP